MGGAGGRVGPAELTGCLRKSVGFGAGNVERYPSGQREQTVNLPAYAFEGSNPSLSTSWREAGSRIQGGNSSVGRASAFQAEGRGFESRFPLHERTRSKRRMDRMRMRAHVAQSVEHFLGKEEVTGSNPVMGSSARHNGKE
jgi:hypothetical protein